MTTAQLLKQQQPTLKVQSISTITLGYIHAHQGSKEHLHRERLRILLDTGCGGTLVNQYSVRHLKCRKTKSGTTWNNQGWTILHEAYVPDYLYVA